MIKKKISEIWGKFLVFNVTFIIILFLFIRTEFIGDLIIGISGYGLFALIFDGTFNPPINLYYFYTFIWSLIFYNIWFYFLSHENKGIRVWSWIIFGIYVFLIFIITFIVAGIFSFANLS